MSVRTRIAPSPTGDPHVGTAYIALFNYCFAKQHGGEFLLRIEDTDQVRSTRESEEAILEALKWCGLQWDEGPDVGGPCGPYRQSERSDLYAEHAKILLDKGHAFHCFCTSDDLDASRQRRKEAGENPYGYDGKCLSLDADEVQKRLDAGEEHVIRMKVPRHIDSIKFNDRLRGEIDWKTDEIDMQVLLKSDGLPTYHLANVVDDHHMKITHVIRGEEWISSGPKHKLLYDYFGWEMPELTHMPLLRNPDKSKLSKRKNPTGILYFKRMGYLPGSLLNYLGLMGWSLPRVDDQEPEEIFNLETMVENFSIDRVSLGGPIFDVVKLDHVNHQWLMGLSEDEYAAAVCDWALNEEYLKPMISMVQQRAKKFTELVDWVTPMFSTSPGEDFEIDISKAKGIDDNDQLLEVLQFTVWHLERLRTWDSQVIGEQLREASELCEIKFGSLMKVVYQIVTGSTSGPPMFDTLAHIGPDMSRARFRDAINSKQLGGVGKKKEKKLSKKYDAALAALEAKRAAEEEGDS